MALFSGRKEPGSFERGAVGRPPWRKGGEREKSYLFSAVVNYFTAKPVASSAKLCQDLLRDPKFSLGQVVALVPLRSRAKEEPPASLPRRELAPKPVLWSTDTRVFLVCLTRAGWDLTGAPRALPGGIRRVFLSHFSIHDGET